MFLCDRTGLFADGVFGFGNLVISESWDIR